MVMHAHFAEHSNVETGPLEAAEEVEELAPEQQPGHGLHLPHHFVGLVRTEHLVVVLQRAGDAEQPQRVRREVKPVPTQVVHCVSEFLN